MNRQCFHRFNPPWNALEADSSIGVNHISKHIMAIANIEIRDLSRNKDSEDNIAFQMLTFNDFLWQKVFIIQKKHYSLIQEGTLRFNIGSWGSI